MQATDPSPSSVYDAHPLDLQSATHIRLVEPIYGQTYLSDDSPELRMQSVSYRLYVFSLDNAPLFTALSYVWGPPEVTKTICLDGKLVEVRKNLWDFLSYYEPQEPSKYLWIDALCINQDSIKERNHQVGIMGQIYRRAAMVIAWLGLGYDEALSLIPNALDDFIAEFRPCTNDASSSLEIERVVAARPVFPGCFLTISESDYWSRLWIVQEFVVNSCLRIGSGRLLLDVDAIFERLRDASVPGNLLLHVMHFSCSERAYRVLLSRQQRVTKESLRYNWYKSHNLIPTFSGSECADVRDHVFGLVGLFNEQELRVHPIIVDYSQSVTTLFSKMCERVREQLLDSGDVGVIKSRLGTFADNLREALQLPPTFGMEDGVPTSRISLGIKDRFKDRLRGNSRDR